VTYSSNGTVIQNYPYMKLFILILSLSLCSCSSSKIPGGEKQRHLSNEYEVYSIDSTNNYYLICVKKDDKPYKIISKKIGSQKCNKIQINMCYEIELCQNLLKEYPSDKSELAPMNYLEMQNCVTLDDGSQVCRERFMDGVYYSDSISGLCID
jgi:hypothetical protein